MANNDLIRGGTASVTSGQTAVIGQNVSWTNVLEGDFFGAHVGLAVPIQSVVGDVITLAYPWPGPTQATAAYAIQPKGDSIRFGLDVRNLLVALSDGDLAAIAALPTDADKLAYFTGPGAAALTNFPAAARNFLANFTPPVARSGGVGMFDRVVRIGWDGAALLGQVDTVLLGKVYTDSLVTLSIANPGLLKLPNGFTLQWGYVNAASGEVEIPFGTAFTSAQVVLVTPIGTAAANVSIAQWVKSMTSSSFVLSSRGTTNGGSVTSGGFPTFWFAVGRI